MVKYFDQSFNVLLVYLGKLRTTKVAIKVANTKMSQDEFIREANFQLAIPPHPNIVQLLGISIDGPQPLVVLEYCNEGSLDKVLFEGDRLRTPAEQIALAEAIARGIDHLHQNNIVHRDLAVRNILLHKGEPKISDFGMSRKLKEVSQVGKTAATIGPLRWMAPEALGKQLYSTKSDVWSFGMILFEVVAHEEPHEHDNLISVAISIRDEGFAPSIPDTVLQYFVKRCRCAGKWIRMSDLQCLESRKKNVGKTATNIRWMAPESIGARNYSKKTDIWTFGRFCTILLPERSLMLAKTCRLQC